MSEKLPRPPRKVTPEVFYTEYLPAVWQAVIGGGEISWPSASTYLEILVDDDCYTLGVGPKGFSVTNTTQDKAHVRIACDREAWANSLSLLWPQVLTHIEEDLGKARGYMQAICYTISHSFMTALVKLPGTVALSYTDDAGDTYVYKVIINRAEKPFATVHLKDEDCQRMAEAENVAAAFLQSKLRIDGDAGYVFALGQALAS